MCCGLAVARPLFCFRINRFRCSRFLSAPRAILVASEMADRGNTDHAVDLAAIVASAPFEHPEQARVNLERISRLVSANVQQAFAALFGDLPNPDLALNQFERLLAVPSHCEIAILFDRELFLVHYALTVFSNSRWLGETLIQNPDLLHAFARERNLERVRSVDDFRESFARFRSRSFDTDIALLLARFKRREYVRIMMRDTLGLATLAETTAEISALADVLIQEALRLCESNLRNRYGTPQRVDAEGRLSDAPFAILSLGKLGGNELNYSSDVDLLYVYGDGPDAGTATITMREFFIRLAQELTGVLSRVTQEGPVFRIDLRLRPQGSQGELVVSLGHALRYYAESAQDWELQALIKLRHSAGDQALARAFIRQVQPSVYRGELNFAAIETALNSLEKIKLRASRGLSSRHAPAPLDVKLDRGGIRDIEFLVQCLQRVYGGQERWLRSGGTLFSLSKLHDKGHISGKDFHELTQSYTFLRTVEHRLQLRLGQQTHKLPSGAGELRALYRSVTGDRNHPATSAIVDLVQKHMEKVASIYYRIVHQQHSAREQGLLPAEPSASLSIGEVTGEHAYGIILARLAVDSRELYEFAAGLPLGSLARRNLFRFLSATCTSSRRYRLLIEHAPAVIGIRSIFEHSSFLTDVLARHPEDIVVIPLEQDNTSAEPEHRVHCLAAEFAAHPPAHEDAMRIMRTEFRQRLLRTASHSVLHAPSVWQTLNEHSHTADAMIAAAMAAAEVPGHFGVLALGRLGTSEFDVLSDADLLFVRGEDTDADACSRAAGKVVEMLSAYTRNGTIFPVDMRLRPHGGSGDLVSTPRQLATYCERGAQAWEAITYLKARPIAGDPVLLDRSLAALSRIRERFSTSESLARDLHAMRNRLESSDRAFNLKLSAGGAYDLDFVTGFLWIRHMLPVKPSNMVTRLDTLCEASILSSETARDLMEAATLFRSVEHAIRLVEGRAAKFISRNAAARASVERLVRALISPGFAGDLEPLLVETMSRVRSCYSILVK